MNENEKVVAQPESGNDKEAYLAAMRQLEQEKKDAKKAKKKKRRKKVLIAFLVIIIGFIAFMVISPSIFAGDSIGNIKDYINNPEGRTSSLEYVVNEYIGYDFHSEEKEMKNLFKLGKQAIEAEDYATGAYLLKHCIAFSEEYKEKISNDIGDADKILLKGARAAVKAEDYGVAAGIYAAYKGSENIKNEYNEACYQLAISYIADKKYADASVSLNMLGDYKYTKQLKLWLDVEKCKDFNDPSKARSELVSRLKDPSSYQEISTLCSVLPRVVEDKKDGIYVKMVNFVTIEYSATNSFGGRITDSYHWDSGDFSVKIKVEGLSKSEVQSVIKLKQKDIIEKAKNYK